MPKHYAIELSKLAEVMGETLLDVEEAEEDQTDPASVILHFSNGKELEVWITDGGNLRLEGD
jgi:hypothetical protein